MVEAALERARAGSGSRSDFEHSYPHCWRCHQPVIFLATPQWFISMDGLRDGRGGREPTRCGGFRTWGRERMTGMFVDAAGLVHLAPARLGRADPRARLHGCGDVDR